MNIHEGEFTNPILFLFPGGAIVYRTSRSICSSCAAQLTKTTLVTSFPEEVAVGVLPSPEIQDECIVNVGLTR